ncbi:Protease synthase and sporulation negative regulatory protein PAI 1 [compost metagenome]
MIAYSKLTHGADEPFLSYKQNDTVELCRFYVLQEWHSRGIAHRLMQECLRIAREDLCCKSIWLGVWEHNHRAQKFYGKYKFESVGEHVFQMGDDAQTDYVMELIL